jgi:predicted nucleic acid-binding protein
MTNKAGRIKSHFRDESLLDTAGSSHEWVLVDADAFVALAREDDSNHQRASDICKMLQKKGATYLVSPFAVAEAVTIISHKISQKAAVAFLEEVRTMDNLSEISLPEQCGLLVDAWFRKQKKKGTSYFDCYNCRARAVRVCNWRKPSALGGWSPTIWPFWKDLVSKLPRYSALTRFTGEMVLG